MTHHTSYSFNLTELISVLEETYKSTTITKFCLKSLCNEIYVLLNEWILPDSPIHDPRTQECTCTSIISQNQDNLKKYDSVIKEVDSVINKARELRKSSSINLNKKPLINKKPLQEKPKNPPTRPISQTLNRNGFKLTRPRSVLVKSKRPPPHLMTTYQEEFTQKVKPSNHKSKERYVKSNCSSAPPLRNTNPTSSTTKKTITPSEISGIITKLANSLKIEEPLIKPPQSSSNFSVISDSCSLHNGGISNKICGKRSFNLQEAIDIIGIPSELVNILKSYHKHLTQILTGRGMTKSQNAANIFLRKLEETNEEYNLKCADSLIELFLMLQINIIHLWDNPEIESQKQCTENLKHIDMKYKKWLNFDKTVISNEVLKETSYIRDELSNTCVLPLSTQDWFFHGVWNYDSLVSYIGLMQAPCIRYQNRDEWVNFENNMQEIQKCDFQMKIFHFLNNILMTMNKKNPDIIKYLKLIYTLAHFPKLRIPLIVEST